MPGLRLGGGYAFPLGPGAVSLAGETGFTLTGLENTRADRAGVVPLGARAEYGLFFGRFVLRPGVLLGGIIGLAGEDTGFSLFFGPRLTGEWRFDGNWGLYAGGGVDCIPEPAGTLVLPGAEIGIRYSISRKQPAMGSEREAARQEAERQEAARLEAVRQEAERLEAERQEAARKEAARLEAERQEIERQEAAHQEAERQEAERLEAERQEAERQEAARLEAERQEAERQEAERQEAERLEAERQEAARQEAERQEAARLEVERQEAARQEAARLEAERQKAARGTWAVQEGDTLTNIAERVYGDPGKWELIYEANRGRLPVSGNPHLILPGMTLDIPAADAGGKR